MIVPLRGTTSWPMVRKKAQKAHPMRLQKAQKAHAAFLYAPFEGALDNKEDERGIRIGLCAFKRRIQEDCTRVSWPMRL